MSDGAAAAAAATAAGGDDVLLEFGTGRPLGELSTRFLDAQYALNPSVRENWRLILTHTEIQLAIRYVANELNARFKDEKIVLTAILKGAYLFLSDLTKLLTIPYTVYFVEASSYGDSQKQSDEVQLLSRLVPSKFHGRKVVLIDELFDHGTTMQSIKQHLLNEKELRLTPEDVFTCTLFAKDNPTKLPRPNLVGITGIPTIWLVGYGLDDQGTKRGWAHLYAVPKLEGIPKCAADAIFGDADGDDAKKAFADMRGVFISQLVALRDKVLAVSGATSAGAVQQPF